MHFLPKFLSSILNFCVFALLFFFGPMSRYLAIYCSLSKEPILKLLIARRYVG